jgi:hypothetical protein
MISNVSPHRRSQFPAEYARRYEFKYAANPDAAPNCNSAAASARGSRTSSAKARQQHSCLRSPSSKLPGESFWQIGRKRTFRNDAMNAIGRNKGTAISIGANTWSLTFQ